MSNDNSMVTSNDDNTFYALTQMIWSLCTGKPTDFDSLPGTERAILRVLFPENLVLESDALSQSPGGRMTISCLAVAARPEMNERYPEMALCTTARMASEHYGPQVKIWPLTPDYTPKNLLGDIQRPDFGRSDRNLNLVR